MPLFQDQPSIWSRLRGTSQKSSEVAGDGSISNSWNSAPATPQPTQPQQATRNRWGRASVVVALVLLRAGLLVYRIVHDQHRVHAQVETTPAARHPDGAIASLDELHGSGRIYLVQLGAHKDGYSTVELAAWLREKYSLDTEVVNPVGLDPAALDNSRHRYMAELLIEQMRREHPDLAGNPKAVLIGFTDAPMYSVTEPWSASFSQRDEHRAAVISSADVNDPGFLASIFHRTNSSMSAVTAGDRMRRILLKDVAVLYWHLPLNNDATSVLSYVLDPDLPGADIYKSDLDSQLSSGEVLGDPCIVFTYSTHAGERPALDAPSNDLIRECQHPESAGLEQSGLNTPDSPPDAAQERMELRLNDGILTEKHTDFYLPGPVPIRFERALSNWWQMPEAFGKGGSHNYDRYLGTWDDMRHIAVTNPGSGGDWMVREPEWLSVLSLDKWVDTDDSGRNLTMRFSKASGPHFELTRFNGEIDYYMACTDREVCYLDGYKDSKGQLLVMQRDGMRRLTSLSSPDNKWLHLTYGLPAGTSMQGSITEIEDSAGRKVQYHYNEDGQLAEVDYPSGESLRYGYDKQQNLLNVNVSPSAGAPDVLLITNEYEHGRLVRQTLPDGKVWRYTYTAAENAETVRSMTVQTPDGAIYALGFSRDGAAIRRWPAEIVPTLPNLQKRAGKDSSSSGSQS
jgi:YD repeat-containing protein